MRQLLRPFSWLYGAGVYARNSYHDRVSPNKLEVPVVSVGGFTIGGSGKTPVVAAIAKELLKSQPVAVLSRGYGRKSTEPFVLVSDGKSVLADPFMGGDEPVELAGLVQGLVVAVGPDRYDVGAKLLDRFGPHVMVLDDGFQHRNLDRDVDLVCFECKEETSELALLPVGRLREPLENILRADAIVFTGWHKDFVSPLVFENVPSFRAVTHVVGFSRINSEEPQLSADTFRDELVGLFVSTASPERIRADLDTSICFFVARRDHHMWVEKEVQSISDRAKSKGANVLLTTGKDSVKLEGIATSLPIYSIDIETEILDIEELRKLITFKPLSSSV